MSYTNNRCVITFSLFVYCSFLFVLFFFVFFYLLPFFFLMYKPKSISIAGITFKVQYKPINDYGLCDIDKKVITIRDSLSNQETLETILHESLHACLAVSGLSYLLNNEDTEEALIRCIDSLYIPIIKNQLSRYKNKIKQN